MRRMRTRLVAVSRDAVTCKQSGLFRCFGNFEILTGPSLKAFPETLDEAWEAEQIEHLINVRITLSDWPWMAGSYEFQSFNPLSDSWTSCHPLLLNSSLLLNDC
jgi:hypothetical protein